MKSEMRFGFVGMGNMAQAIAAGFVASKKIAAENIFAFAPNQKKLSENAKKIGFVPCASNLDLAKNCDVIFIACKPYQIESVLSEIGDALKNKVLVSIAATWTLATYKNALGNIFDSIRIQCVMPNTPSRIGQGVILFEQENSLGEGEAETLKDLFGALGLVETLPSRLMGIGGAISGCGPAFMDLIIEAYADAAVKYGIAREQAYRLVGKTMAGSADLQLQTGGHPGVLKDAVCSPGGTTIRGVCALEKSGLRAACIASVDAVMGK